MRSARACMPLRTVASTTHIQASPDVTRYVGPRGTGSTSVEVGILVTTLAPHSVTTDPLPTPPILKDDTLSAEPRPIVQALALQLRGRIVILITGIHSCQPCVARGAESFRSGERDKSVRLVVGTVRAKLIPWPRGCAVESSIDPALMFSTVVYPTHALLVDLACLKTSVRVGDV